MCGKVIGVQKGAPNAFGPSHANRGINIDQGYVDGVIISYGSPQKHIWSFAAAGRDAGLIRYNCPCSDPSATFDGKIPTFVGNDYFCETGNHGEADMCRTSYFTGDPLWDGKGCVTPSTCCTGGKKPYFEKTYASAVRGDIEVRLCANDARATKEDVLLEVLNLWVQ